MGRIAVHDFADGSDAAFIKVGGETRQQFLRMRGVAIYAEVRQCERTEQPVPYRTLVIGGVPLARVAAILPGVPRVTRREAPQTDRRQQLARAGIHDRTSAPRIQQVGTERYRKDLIGSQAGIRARAARAGCALGTIHDVVELTAFLEPECR